MSEGVQIPEELQIAIIGDFLQTAAGQGVQTLIQLTTERSALGIRSDSIRLNAALALTGMYDLMVDAEYEDDSKVRYVDEDELTHGDVIQGMEGPTETEPEGQVTTEEALARLQALRGQNQTEPDDGAGNMGGASGLGPRNPRASRKRRKHGRR